MALVCAALLVGFGWEAIAAMLRDRAFDVASGLKNAVAGFFAVGEIGPAGAHSFLHGQAASIVFFVPE